MALKAKKSFKESALQLYTHQQVALKAKKSFKETNEEGKYMVDSLA